MGGSAMQATQKQLSDAKIDLAYRDFCAHLLIPLNECRKRSYFLPWKCEHERHVYEKCQYKECVERVMHDARGSGVPVKSFPPQIERHPRVERPRPSSVEPQNPRDDRQPDRAERDGMRSRLSTPARRFFSRKRLPSRGETFATDARTTSSSPGT